MKIFRPEEADLEPLAFGKPPKGPDKPGNQPAVFHTDIVSTTNGETWCVRTPSEQLHRELGTPENPQTRRAMLEVILRKLEETDGRAFLMQLRQKGAFGLIVRDADEEHVVWIVPIRPN